MLGECTLGTRAPLRVSCMQANVATSESPLPHRRNLCICSQPDVPVWCQITEKCQVSRASRPESSRFRALHALAFAMLQEEAVSLLQDQMLRALG